MIVPPNPGSSAALAAGCRCPRLDNCNGKFPPYPPDGWVIATRCPLHGAMPEAPWGEPVTDDTKET